MTKPTTRQAQYGTQYLYEVTYTDPSDECIGEQTQRLWAYNIEHALDRFYGAIDADGWKALRVARVPAEGGMHRAVQHEATSACRVAP